jgi:hypothetical protein
VRGNEATRGENVVIVIAGRSGQHRKYGTAPAHIHAAIAGHAPSFARPAGAMLEHSWRSGAGNRLMAKGYAAPLLSVLR